MDAIYGGAPAFLIDGVLAAVLAISVATDARERKIFDRVTMPAIVAGLLINLQFSGWPGAVFSLGGMATALCLVIAVTLLAGNGLGGGDVKLLTAVGALCGPRFVPWASAFAALSGPILWLVPLMRERLLGYTLRNFAHNCVACFLFGAPVGIAERTRAGRQPFSVAIAAGVLLAAISLARR